MPSHVYPGVRALFPDTLTILATYRCNAACEQCCFESNPKISGRLSLDTIKAHIDQAADAFPALQIVVFSGGECFLLKEDLYAAIRHATSKNLLTRCVTNAFWGKTATHAKKVVEELVAAGLTELNISTGLDHQKWVPFSSVVTAAKILVDAGIRTLITIERDSETSRCYTTAIENRTVTTLLKEHPDRFYIQTNSWMPFHDDAVPRARIEDRTQLKQGCPQLFHNTVVTPHNKLSA
ncbi:MAG TPA: radical SAM protein, partial [Gammaproteobacteria bacterium]|nr:radical SAM protein [Gammaproteobacteria bacterium]